MVVETPPCLLRQIHKHMPVLKNFCHLAWTNLIVDLDKDLWRWCPKIGYQKSFESEYPFNENLLKVKQQFKNDQRPQACSSCWRDEDLGFRSFREQRQTNVTYNADAGLRTIDLFLGADCNSNCITCGPRSSTSWQQLTQQKDSNEFAWLKIPIHPVSAAREQAYIKFKSLLEQNKHSLRLLNITGGEPTDHPHFQDLVEHLVSLGEMSRCNLRLVTNGNCDPAWLDGMLSRLEENGWLIELVISIDAVEQDLEFVRAGVSWERLQENLITSIKSGRCSSINLMVSALNLHMLDRVPRWLYSQGLLDQVKPRFIKAHGAFSIHHLGEIALYLSPRWGKKIAEHEAWKDPITEINLSIRKQRFVQPDHAHLARLCNYVKWFANVNGQDIPPRLVKLIYLSDIARRIPSRTDKKTEDVDPNNIPQEITDDESDLG